MKSLKYGIAAIALLSPVSALAQIDEIIIVTAQKRAQSVQEVPASLSVVTADTLNQRGIRGVEDLMFATPSLTVGRQNGFSNITIRGVGRNEGSPGVAIYMDGVYQPRAEMGDLAQLDLERVEVLRGPQGTIYGRNANGGVINFITAAPTEEFGGYIRAGLATYNEWRTQGVINVPLHEKIRTRLTVDWVDRNKGFVENVGTGPDIQDEQTLNARLRVSGDITETFGYDMNFSMVRSSGAFSHVEVIDGPDPLSAMLLPALTTANFVTEAHKTSINGPVDSDRKYNAVSGTFTWDLHENAQLKSITAYSVFEDDELRDDDALDITTFHANRVAKTKTLTQELNLLWSTPGDELEGVLGFFYLRDNHENLLAYNDIATGFGMTPPNSSLSFVSPSLKTESISVFLDLTWNVFDRLRLIGGLRWLDDTAEHTQAAFGSFGPPPPLVATCTPQTNEVNFEQTIFRGGLQFDLFENSTLYATYSEGFKSGGFNFFSCDGRFEPEEIEAWEVGVKNELLDGSLVLNLSAFDYSYTDLQLRQVVGLAAVITNAAGAKIRGLEAEAQWLATEGLAFNAALTLLDTEYRDFLNTDVFDFASGQQDLSGNRLNAAPEVALNIGASYESGPVFGGGSLSARVDASYRSDQYFREFNNEADRQKAYTILQASFGWNSPNDKYQLRIFGDNLTDKDYITYMAASQPNGARIVNWGTPRQIGAEMTVNF